MDPKRIIHCGLVIMSVMALVSWADSPAGRPKGVPPGDASSQAPPFALKPDLAIGVEDGDESLMLGRISRVELDAKGNIHILDAKFRKIVVCDAEGRFLRAVAVPAGQGPTEATNLSGIAVTPGGTLFVNDMRKIIVYGPDGEYLRTFLIDHMVSSIGCAGTEELVALGPHGGKILHVLSSEGARLASFGDTFAPPDELAPMKDMPMVGAPFLFNCAKDGRIFVLNPHKYEIWIFKDRELERTIAGKNDRFMPVQQKGRGIVSTAAHILASGDLLLVALQAAGPAAGNVADIFRAGNQIGALDIPGTPMAVDAQGRLYFAETDPFPRVVRYAVVMN